MAKQTFTTGQVLTAAQMTSLQQTAMCGGAASAKTASYTLVAADAGGAISMNSATSTTITVNTALFAAGDTVFITNLGAGICTITAGTATVNSSASLALAQYESGFLDFTTTSAAIFVKGSGAAAASGGMTLISTTACTGTSVVLSSIPGTYTNLQVIIDNFAPSAAAKLEARYNGQGGTTHQSAYFSLGSTTFLNPTSKTSQARLTDANLRASNNETRLFMNIPYYSSTDNQKKLTQFQLAGQNTSNQDTQSMGYIMYQQNNTAITQLEFFWDTGTTFASGTAYLWGIK